LPFELLALEIVIHTDGVFIRLMEMLKGDGGGQ
jgi:hypothetical protein